MAFELHITIPEDSPAGQVVQRVVSAERVTPEQAVTRILTEMAKLESMETSTEGRTELGEAIARVRVQYPTYASLFGAVKGPGAHGSKEAVDRYIAEQRDEW